MRRLNRDEYAREMRAKGLGNYGEGNSNVLSNNVYSEREVFRGESSSLGNGGVSAVAEPIRVVRNRIFFTLANFSFSSTDGSQTILPTNERRRFFTIQNQSTADFMYVNFSSDAGINVGLELYPAQAIVYDTIVPYNSITVFVNSATRQVGAVVEGTLQL